MNSVTPTNLNIEETLEDIRNVFLHIEGKLAKCSENKALLEALLYHYVKKYGNIDVVLTELLDISTKYETNLLINKESGNIIIESTEKTNL